MKLLLLKIPDSPDSCGVCITQPKSETRVVAVHGAETKLQSITLVVAVSCSEKEPMGYILMSLSLVLKHNLSIKCWMLMPMVKHNSRSLLIDVDVMSLNYSMLAQHDRCTLRNSFLYWQGRSFCIITLNMVFLTT